MSLYTIGAIAVQALDKSIPVFQLNVARLTGNVHPLPMTGAGFFILSETDCYLPTGLHQKGAYTYHTESNLLDLASKSFTFE